MQGSCNLLNPGRFHSRTFWKGLLNRFVDWLEWIQAETWNFEHNTLHHFSLNEGTRFRSRSCGGARRNGGPSRPVAEPSRLGGAVPRELGDLGAAG